MKRIVILEHLEKKIILTQCFKNEEQACQWWCNLPCAYEWNIIYEKNRELTGHRYDLEYAKFDENGNLYSKHIICYSKKESLFLKKKIKEVNSSYMIYIKKLY